MFVRYDAGNHSCQFTVFFTGLFFTVVVITKKVQVLLSFCTWDMLIPANR